MPSTITFSTNDYDGEAGSHSITADTLTAANFSGLALQIDEYEGAMLAIQRGVLTTRQTANLRRVESSVTRSTDPEAQREAKWLVTYEDASPTLGAGVANPGYRKVYSTEVPCADLSLRASNNDVVYQNFGTPIVDDPLFTTYVAAFEVLVKSPTGGSVVVRTIRAVGRNS